MGLSQVSVNLEANMLSRCWRRHELTVKWLLLMRLQMHHLNPFIPFSKIPVAGEDAGAVLIGATST